MPVDEFGEGGEVPIDLLLLGGGRPVPIDWADCVGVDGGGGAVPMEVFGGGRGAVPVRELSGGDADADAVRWAVLPIEAILRGISRTKTV